MDDPFIDRLARLGDDALVAAIRDAQARGARRVVGHGWDLLIARNQRRVRYALHAAPEERVEEMAQQVWLDAHAAVAAGKRIDAFGPWITKVARHHVADFWRGKEGRQLGVDREAAARAVGDPEARRELPGPIEEGDFGAWEVHDAVEGLLARRSPQHRRMVEAFVLQGLPAREVAAACGETADNVYQVAKRFRDDLRRALRGEPTDDNDDPGARPGDRT